MRSNLKNRLHNTNGFFFCVYAIVAAFGTYSCMYAFRKPFTVATFEDQSFLGVDYKIWLITAQVVGYTLSKFLGIKIVSELKKNSRAISTIILVAIAELALLLFAITPKPVDIFFLFMNGLPLGMVWGIVFSYLEGRRYTEVLGAGLCISFIFSSGFVKSVGKWLMVDMGISESWMPFTTGVLFILPLLVFQFMLEQIPEPDEKDQSLRTKRVMMNKNLRKEMLFSFGPGLLLLVISYMMLTAFRDFRDNFAAEIWTSLGYGTSAEIFTYSEIPISIFILLIMSLIMLVKNNFQALMINHFLVITGFCLLSVSTIMFEIHIIAPVPWMIFVGMGLYLGYVPFNSIFFDRMIAAFKSIGNVGFLIYLADSFGYLGSVGVLFYKNFSYPNLSWINFFKSGAIVVGCSGMITVLISMVFFYQKHRKSVAAIKQAELIPL